MSLPDKESYHDTMNRWAKHQKFWWKFWHLWLRPTPYAGIGRRLWGYFWRLMVATALGGLIYLQVLKARAASSATTSRFQQALRNFTGFQKLESEPLQWGDRLSLPKLRAEGRQGILRIDAEMRGLTMEAPPWYGATSDSWNLGRLNAWEAGFLISAPAKQQPSDKTSSPSVATIPPDLSIDIPEWEVTRASALWDEGGALAGSLKDTRIHTVRNGTAWDTTLKEGTLDLPWLPPLLLDTVHVRVAARQATIGKESSLHLEDGGSGLVSGGLAWNDKGLSMHLGLLFQEVETAWLLPEPWNDMLEATGDVKLSLEGAMEPGGTAALSFEAQLREGRLGSLHATRFLGGRLRHYELSQLAFESATLTGRASKEGGIEISSLAFTEKSLKVQVRATLKVLNKLASGELRLGFSPVDFAGNASLAALGTPGQEDGLVWITIPLSGQPDTLSKTWTEQRLAESRSGNKDSAPESTNDGLIQPGRGQPPVDLPPELQ